ncbi:MAG: response regulator [Spirochaetales bacterium]|nr:response regulator [Spirochaetales bacterium]
MSKILIVDDEKRIRSLYGNLLRNENFDVVEAADICEADEILRNEEIMLVLLDIRLPKIDGSTYYKMMRVFHEKTKVIVASVYPIEEQRHLIPDADDYFDKAQGTDVLLELIKKFCNREIIYQDADIIVKLDKNKALVTIAFKKRKAWDAGNNEHIILSFGEWKNLIKVIEQAKTCFFHSEPQDINKGNVRIHWLSEHFLEFSIGKKINNSFSPKAFIEFSTMIEKAHKKFSTKPY